MEPELIETDAEPTFDEQVAAEFESMADAPDAPSALEDAVAEIVAEGDDGADATAPEATEDASPADATSAAGSAGDATPDPEERVMFLDREMSRNEAEQLAGLYDWATSLSPAEAERIVKAAQAPAAVGVVDTAVGDAQGVTTPVGEDKPAIEFDPDFVDPAVISSFQAMQARLDQLEAQTTASQRAAEHQQQLEAERAVQTARGTISEKYGFSDIEMDTVGRRAAESQIVPWVRSQLADANGYVDPEVLFTEVLDRTIWNDPQLREAALKSQLAGTQAEVVDIQQANASRKAKAGSVSSSGGSVPRTAPSPQSLPPQERHKAMEQEIAQAMGG